jgi:hypothetical protein
MVAYLVYRTALFIYGESTHILIRKTTQVHLMTMIENANFRGPAHSRGFHIHSQVNDLMVSDGTMS